MQRLVMRTWTEFVKVLSLKLPWTWNIKEEMDFRHMIKRRT